MLKDLNNDYLDELVKFEAPGLTLLDEDISIVWSEAKGTVITDLNGDNYLDMASGLNVANVGHSNPYVVEKAKLQLDKLIQGMGDFHANQQKIALLKKLNDISPIEDNKIILSVNGSDAVDSALKTASLYTGKSRFISFYGGYHGQGAKSLEVTARSHFKNPYNKELHLNTIFLPFPYAFKTGKNEKEEIKYCLELVRETIENEAAGGTDIAGIIVEVFQGRGGVLEAPREFLKGLREICDRNKIILIFDEILSGFGRTGKWFGFQHSNILPDIFTIGKGLGGGYPISACIGKSEVMNCWGEVSGESTHTSTFQGNPLGCTMALATIEYIENNNLLEYSNSTGQYFINQLQKRLSTHPRVGDIRGQGMMIGIEFIKDDKTYTPDPDYCWEVIREGKKEKIIFLNGGHSVNCLCLTPPLIITKEEIDFCIDKLEEIINRLV